MLASVPGLQKHTSSRGMYGCLRAVAAIPVLLGVSRARTTRTISRGLRRRYVFIIYASTCSGAGVGHPRPSRDSRTKEGTSVVLSQHVWKTGNPIRSLDLKLSCDIKVVPHGTRSRPDIDDAKLAQNARVSDR